MLVAILSILVSVFCVLFGIFHFFGNRELYNKTEHIKGPRVFPLIGNAYRFIGDSEHFLKQVSKMISTYDSPFRIVLATRVFVVTKNPEHAKIILQSPQTVEKDLIYEFAKPWLGNGLVTADHKVWRNYRKIIQPTFHHKILQSFVPIFVKNSLLLIKALEDKVGGPEFEISPYIAFLTISNICESSIGISVESQAADLKKFYDVNVKIFEDLIKRLIQVWLHSDFIFQFSQLSKVIGDSIKYVHGFTDEIIKKRRNLHKASTKDEEATFEKRKPTLEFLLEIVDKKNQLNDVEIREQVLTVIIAGSDTTARTIGFILFLLSQHSTVQDKVYEEIYDIYGSEDPKNNPVKYEDLNQLVYLERV